MNLATNTHSTSTALQDVSGPQFSHVLTCPGCPWLSLGALQGAAPAAFPALACPLPSDPCAVPGATYGCRIKQACWHLCVCHCDESVAGNLSHSACTCENPNLCMLAFVCITLQGRQLNYQGEVTVQRPFVHAELHHVLTFFASVVTKLQESAIWSLPPPSGALFFFSCYSGITSGIFRNTNLLFFRKISMEVCQRNTPQTQKMHYVKTPCSH